MRIGGTDRWFALAAWHRPVAFPARSPAPCRDVARCPVRADDPREEVRPKSNVPAATDICDAQRKAAIDALRAVGAATHDQRRPRCVTRRDGRRERPGCPALGALTPTFRLS